MQDEIPSDMSKCAPTQSNTCGTGPRVFSDYLIQNDSSGYTKLPWAGESGDEMIDLLYDEMANLFSTYVI